MNNQYKNASGAYLLRGLFYETTGADKTGVIYTLKDETHEGYPSLKELYMKVGDLTEYHFAIGFLGGVDHWEKLCESSWFKPYVDQWRRELELRFKAEALARIIEESRRDLSPSKFTANKYILEKGWEPKESTKRGRPSKQSIRDAAHDILQGTSQIVDDFERLGIKVN